jgi:hypothetical protein
MAGLPALRSASRLAAVVALMWAASGASAADYAPSDIDAQVGNARVFVLTDIGNEPDDQMSLVRLLLYSNELDLEGLVATTSTWKKDYGQPEYLGPVIDAYAEVRPNLLKHAAGWPDVEALRARVSIGPEGYGMAAIKPEQPSPGAKALFEAARRGDPRPLWITIWGGANTLAEALAYARVHLEPAQLAALVAKLRVHSISDQDDAGPWVRREFPRLFYIVKPSGPNAEEYASATWTGISGDVYYRNCAGADGSTVTNEWLDTHIRNKGPLGKVYPQFEFIMEGDTPSFLGLTQNGLSSAANPSWGGWGGRYVYRQPYGESRAIWTQGGDAFARTTSQDLVFGHDGKAYLSDQATIWRWRRAFQHDFAARMDWTIRERADANHAPQVVVNGSAGTAPIYLDAEVGKPVTLDASAASDPDGHKLGFRWFHYGEAGFVPGSALARVSLSATNTALTNVTVTEACRPAWHPSREPCPQSSAHIILEVTDNGAPALTSYRRVILNVRGATGR